MPQFAATAARRSTGNAASRTGRARSPSRLRARPTARRLQRSTRDERVRHKGELIYPNFLLSLSAEHVAAFCIWPRGPQRTEVVCDFLFHPDEMAKPSFEPGDAVEFWDLVNRQDWEVCEGLQRGMRSRRFDYGWYAPMESPSLDIRDYIAARLGPDAVGLAMTRDVEYVVLGLGGIGSGAAYWLSRFAGGGGGRARAVRTRSRPRRVARSHAHHPPVVSHARVRRTGQARLRRVVGAGGRVGRDRRREDRWPRPVAARRCHSASRLRRVHARLRRAVRPARRGRSAPALAAVPRRRRRRGAVPGGRRVRDRAARDGRASADGPRARRDVARRRGGDR